MPTQRIRRSAGAGMLLVCAAALVSCDPWPDAPNWSARLLDGQLEIAFCEPTVGDRLTGYIENERGARWTRFWDVTGHFDFDEGEILRVGVDSGGVRTSDLHLDLLEEHSVVVVYRRVDGTTDTGAVFELDANAPPGSWVTTRGAVTFTPCE